MHESFIARRFIHPFGVHATGSLSLVYKRLFCDPESLPDDSRPDIAVGDMELDSDFTGQPLLLLIVDELLFCTRSPRVSPVSSFS